MTRNIFTFVERTVKKYNVGQAYTHALAALKDKGYEQVCVNCLRGKDNDLPLTLEEMSNLVEDMMQDTYYYDGWKIQSRN